MEEDPADLFKRLNDELYSHIDQQYFQEPRDFKSLVEVLNVLESRVDQIIYQNKVVGGDGQGGSSYEAGNSLNDLQKQLEVVKRVIEDVVTFQQGGMNNSLDTMREVVKEYCRGREEIQRLRKSLAETQTVLTAKKTGQISLRELWLKKAELQESLRLVRDIEELKNVPHKVFRLMQQKRYYAAVLTLNSAVKKMFSEDLVGVGGLVQIRETIMDLKENLLDACVQELKEQIVGAVPDFQFVSETQEASETASMADFEAQSDYGGGGIIGSVLGGGSVYAATVSGGDSARRTSQRLSFSEYAPSRNAGSVSGDSPNLAQQVFAGNPNSATTVGAYGLWPQYRDLKDVDEHVEAALMDPAAAGPVYMRLLVKTVGALRCEEDVERLIFETIFTRFQSYVVQVREIVFKRRQEQWLLDENSHNNVDNHDDATWLVRDGKAFTQFVSALLDSTSGIVSRLLYVWTLLTINRQVREGKIDIATVVSPTVQDVAKTERERARQLLFTVWHDLEDKVWIEIFRHLADPEILKISDAPVTINGSVKRTGGNKQGDKSSSAKRNSTHHQLSDYQPDDLTMVSATVNRVPGQNSGAEQQLLDDGEESKFASDKLLLFHPSSSHAAAVYYKVINYQTVIQRIFKDYSLDSVYFGGNNNLSDMSTTSTSIGKNIPINPFAPPSKASTGITPPQTILQLTRTQDAQRKLQEEMLSHITEPLQAFLESELIPIIQSSVNEDMRAMQMQPVEYFQPRNGSTLVPTANTKSNNNTAGNIRLSTAVTANHSNTTNNTVTVTRRTTTHIAPCRAAERSLFHADSLVRYWQQLSQHRTMVSVVLDRLVRGYAGAAKDHVENLTWNWQSQLLLQQDKSTTRQLLSMLEDDVVYAQYYTQRIFQGKLSLEELLLPVSFSGNNNAVNSNVFSGSFQNASVAKSALLAGSDSHKGMLNGSSSSFSSTIASPRSLAQYFWQEITAIHHGAIWDLTGRSNGGNNMGYLLNDAKALAPLSQGGIAVAGVACVAAACDWLIYRLSVAYNSMMRKVMLANHHFSHGHHHHGHNHRISMSVSSSIPTRRPSTSSDMSGVNVSNNNSSTNSNSALSTANVAIEQMQEIKDSLCLALKEVQRLSKLSLLFLRHSVQIMCFFYLQKLVNINFLTASALNNNSGSNPSVGGGVSSSTGSETVAEDSILSALMQQLHIFVDAVSQGYVLSFNGSSIIPSVLGPIVCLVPRLLLKSITIILQIAPTAALVSPGVGSNTASTGGKGNINVINKTRLLRLVVSGQQLLMAFFNNKLSVSDGESKRRLLEVLSEESERVRKVASLIEAPASEIRLYFKKVAGNRELEKDTAKALWLRATDRANEASFDEVWRDLYGG